MLLFSGNYHNETCSVFVSSQPFSVFSPHSFFFTLFTQFGSTSEYLATPFLSVTTCHVLVLTPVTPSCLTTVSLPPLCPVLFPPEVPVSSVLCLSSVRELPVQVRELYTQGFVLVAVHPFVHPCGPRHAHIQRQLHRAVLVRETPRYTNLTRPCLHFQHCLYSIDPLCSRLIKMNEMINLRINLKSHILI